MEVRAGTLWSQFFPSNFRDQVQVTIYLLSCLSISKKISKHSLSLDNKFAMEYKDAVLFIIWQVLLASPAYFSSLTYRSKGFRTQLSGRGTRQTKKLWMKRMAIKEMRCNSSTGRRLALSHTLTATALTAATLGRMVRVHVISCCKRGAAWESPLWAPCVSTVLLTPLVARLEPVLTVNSNRFHPKGLTVFSLRRKI